MNDYYDEQSHIYVFYKGERVPWIVPGLKNGEVLRLDPATFTPDMLPKGRIKAGDVTMVPIPKLPGRISLRKDGYVEVILYKTHTTTRKLAPVPEPQSHHRIKKPLPSGTHGNQRQLL